MLDTPVPRNYAILGIQNLDLESFGAFGTPGSGTDKYPALELLDNIKPTLRCAQAVFI